MYDIITLGFVRNLRVKLNNPLMGTETCLRASQSSWTGSQSR